MEGNPDLVLTGTEILPVKKGNSSSGAIVSGQEFYLRTAVKNAGNADAKNVRVMLNLNSSSPLIPLEDNVHFIENLSTGSSENISFKLLLGSNAPVQPYRIPLRITASNGAETFQIDKTQEIGINVLNRAKIDISSLKFDQGVPVKGQQVSIFVAIMGSSGSGKSTFLNQLGLLDIPTSGTVIINSIDTSKMSEKEKGNLRLHNLGYVFQDYALLPELSAIENVCLPLMMQGKSKEEYQRAASAVLISVGLEDRLDQFPSKMSGGQQQRVSIAKALAHKPRVLFADEPCANLDSLASKQILELFRKFNKEEDQTIVMVAHEDWHMEYVDRVIRLKDGVLES